MRTLLISVALCLTACGPSSQALTEVQAATGSVSPAWLAGMPGANFSPWMDGQNPERGGRITSEQLWDRLQIVAGDARAFRTYGVDSGLEVAGRMIRSLGREAWIGAWLGPDEEANSVQVAELIRLAKAGNVDVAVVGSEVLLRGDLSEAQLRAHIRAVRAAIPEGIPVTSAEPHDVLLEHSGLADDCDILFVNYYPFWRGHSIDDALQRIDDWHAQVVEFAGGKPVTISETGWPAGGDPHEAAEPSPRNAARFFAEFREWAAEEQVHYFYFSCFDEGWKNGQEGSVGPHWGYRRSDGVIKPELADYMESLTASDPGGQGN